MDLNQENIYFIDKHSYYKNIYTLKRKIAKLKEKNPLDPIIKELYVRLKYLVLQDLHRIDKKKRILDHELFYLEKHIFKTI